MIHGEDMAGLHELVLGHERLTIEYGEIELGARIVYRAEEPGLVSAIHDWFDAQLRDHGDYARGGGDGGVTGFGARRLAVRGSARVRREWNVNSDFQNVNRGCHMLGCHGTAAIA